MAGKVPVGRHRRLLNISRASRSSVSNHPDYARLAPVPWSRQRRASAVAIRSHLEKFGIARLDLLALRQHRGGIRLEQFQRGQRRMAGLFLDLRVKRAMREIIDQQLLSLRTKKEALEQPRCIRIRGAAEHATGNDDERRTFARIDDLDRL